MSHSCINVLIDWLTRRDHVPILEFHGLGPLGPELATHNDLNIQEQISQQLNHPKCTNIYQRTPIKVNYLTTLGTTLHNKAENTIASPDMLKDVSK